MDADNAIANKIIAALSGNILGGQYFAVTNRSMEAILSTN